MPVAPSRSLLSVFLTVQICFCLAACDPPTPIDYSGPLDGWPQAGGSAGGGHFTRATQITRDNVSELAVAWVHRSGDFHDGGNAIDGMNYPAEPLQTSFQVTPILFRDTLYYCTPYNRVFALDPESGEERWMFDPELKLEDYPAPRCRGVSSWTNRQVEEAAPCRHQIVMGTVDARLFALDAATGERCANLGGDGEISLRTGLGDHELTEYGITSPPGIIGNLAIVGGAIADNVSTRVPGGVVRAYDLTTGELAWYWDPVPPNQSPVLDEDGDARYQRGTSNVWTFISTDVELGLIYVPTGNTSPDYYGGHRGDLDHYSSSVVALHAATGEVAWHFQTVHHDIWDYDVPSQPTLFDIERDGVTIKALAQTTKMGLVFLLDRTNGEPLFPVEERAVPQGAVAGDFTVPTQPFPSKPPPLVDTDFTTEDVWGFTPWDRGACADKLANIRTEGLFTPPSVEGSIHYPSAVGGHNWGGPAIDHDRNTLVVNTLHMASIIQLIPRAECADAETARQGDDLASKYASIEPSEGTPYCDLRWIGFFSPLEVPCTPPPWGTLAGIDLVSGELLWQVPLGTTRDVAPFPFWYIDGVPNMGGPVTTASGLTFIAATTDYYLRAFDTLTGEELWKGRLPTGGQATPMSYRLRENSKQYVVIAAGGHWAFGTPAGDHLMAFALHGSGE